MNINSTSEFSSFAESKTGLKTKNRTECGIAHSIGIEKFYGINR